MSKSPKFLLIIICALIITSGALAYRYFVSLDYTIIIPAECDPYTRDCFVTEECDEETEECIELYYSEAHVKAYDVTECDPHTYECAELLCPQGAGRCNKIYCDPERGLEGAVCDEL